MASLYRIVESRFLNGELTATPQASCMPGVLTPLEYISVQVTQSKGIGRGKLMNRSRFRPKDTFKAAVVDAATIVIRHIRRQSFAKAEGGRCVGSTGIFPFRFAG